MAKVVGSSSASPTTGPSNSRSPVGAYHRATCHVCYGRAEEERLGLLLPLPLARPPRRAGGSRGEGSTPARRGELNLGRRRLYGVGEVGCGTRRDRGLRLVRRRSRQRGAPASGRHCPRAGQGRRRRASRTLRAAAAGPAPRILRGEGHRAALLPDPAGRRSIRRRHGRGRGRGMGMGTAAAVGRIRMDGWIVIN